MRKKSHTLVSRWKNEIFWSVSTQTDPQPLPPHPHQKKTGEEQTNGENPFLLSDLKLKTAGNILHGANGKKIF